MGRLQIDFDWTHIYGPFLSLLSLSLNLYKGKALSFQEDAKERKFNFLIVVLTFYLTNNFRFFFMSKKSLDCRWGRQKKRSQTDSELSPHQQTLTVKMKVSPFFFSSQMFFCDPIPKKRSKKKRILNPSTQNPKEKIGEKPNIKKTFFPLLACSQKHI